MVEKEPQDSEFEKEEKMSKRKGIKWPKFDWPKEGAGPNPESSEPSTIFYLHALLLFGGNLLHRVLDFYNSIFELTPTDKAKIYRNISNHYAQKGLHEKALNYLKEWARLDKSNPDAHFHLAIGMAASGNLKVAIRAFDKALKLKPKYKDALYRKSGVCMKLKDYQEAVNALKQLADLDPEFTKAYYLMGIAFDRMDEVDQAIEAIQKATELDSQEIKYYQHLGFLYERKEDHTRAAECFSTVMELQREQDEEDD